MLPCFCCSKFRHRDTCEKVNVLILGLNGSGKTEISYKMAGNERTDQSSTNGSRSFSQKLGKFMAIYTEIGGNEDMRNIWHHYYAKAHALIYVVDLSDDDTIIQSYNIFADVMKHHYIQGKPILVLANKTDLCRQPDILDFYDRFQLEWLANSYQTHILLQCCGHRDYTELHSGLDWLRYRIEVDYHQLNNRIQFDTEPIKEEEEAHPSRIPSIGAFNQIANILRRPKSAPTVPTTSNARAKARGSNTTRHCFAIRRNRIHSANPK